jgi:outer membrane protein OmpA-like peptidoglycan-associated protein
MKTLIIGFIVFLGWTGLSSYIYVCKIKGLCSEHETILVSTVKVNDAYTTDSLPNTLAERPAMPDKLLIYFAFDKSEFISDPDLTKFYDASITYMFHNTDAGLRIIGHTDAKGSDEYNQALGYRRAQSVQNYFESKGIPAEKITIESKGEKEPSEDNNSEEGRAKNRRVIVTIKK